MEFVVTSRAGIERGVKVRPPYIVISIRDPDKPPANVARQPGLRDVLYLAFDDYEHTPGIRLPPEVQLMTQAQALEIRRFIERHETGLATVVVHCEQGISRSAAVAAALCLAFGGDDRRFWSEYLPNRHVFWLLFGIYRATEGGAAEPAT